MTEQAMILVEVVYLTPTQQIVCPIQVIEGSTLWDAIERCEILSKIDRVWPMPVGIFGQRVADPMTHVLRHGDRIELYRPLTRHPMDVRRQRASLHPVGRRRPRL
jgi:putative ubiquitin-RnfH superfamily antitoxin RatB of RatAB toxin-antitoxin module